MSRDATGEHDDMRIAIRADDRSRKILDRELLRKLNASLDIFNSCRRDLRFISEIRIENSFHSDFRFGES